MVTSKWKPDIFMPAKSYHGEGRHGSSTNRYRLMCLNEGTQIFKFTNSESLPSLFSFLYLIVFYCIILFYRPIRNMAAAN